MLNIKELNVQYIIDEAGERRSVILSIDDFETLLEDLAVALERRNEPTVSHQSVKIELQKDGLLSD